MAQTSNVFDLGEVNKGINLFGFYFSTKSKLGLLSDEQKEIVKKYIDDAWIQSGEQDPEFFAMLSAPFLYGRALKVNRDKTGGKVYKYGYRDFNKISLMELRNKYLGRLYLGCAICLLGNGDVDIYKDMTTSTSKCPFWGLLDYASRPLRRDLPLLDDNTSMSRAFFASIFFEYDQLVSGKYNLEVLFKRICRLPAALLLERLLLIHDNLIGKTLMEEFTIICSTEGETCTEAQIGQFLLGNIGLVGLAIVREVTASLDATSKDGVYAQLIISEYSKWYKELSPITQAEEEVYRRDKDKEYSSTKTRSTGQEIVRR